MLKFGLGEITSHPRVFISSNKLRAVFISKRNGLVLLLSILAGKRSALLPKVPTLAESGYPGVEMDTWLAMVAPRGLPPAVKARLELTLAQVVADPETRDKLIAVGFEPTYASAKAVSELIDKELPLMRAVAQRAAITAD